MKDVELHCAIAAEFDHVLSSESLVLDFGCGDGYMVSAYRAAGYQAVGADVHLEYPNEWLKLISAESGTYRLPFPSNSFDFLCSNSVLEHVEDLDAALAEMYRVLRPGGASLHFFPPRWCPIEPHVFVPLAGVVQTRTWLVMWALLGVRNSFQRNWGFRQTAGSNYDYLHQKTFYRSKKDLAQQFQRYFRTVTFADREMIRHSYGGARHLAPLAERMRPLAASYGALHQRCVFARK